MFVARFKAYTLSETFNSQGRFCHRQCLSYSKTSLLFYGVHLSSSFVNERPFFISRCLPDHMEPVQRDEQRRPGGYLPFQVSKLYKRGNSSTSLIICLALSVTLVLVDLAYMTLVVNDTKTVQAGIF